VPKYLLSGYTRNAAALWLNVQALSEQYLLMTDIMIDVGFEVFTAVVMKSIIFWDMMPCSLLSYWLVRVKLSTPMEYTASPVSVAESASGSQTVWLTPG
jgi:hypothetical protein